MAPALVGALDHARQWALTRPAETVVALLATDGLPTECGASADSAELLQEVVDLAATAAQGEVPMRTFVIGVFQVGDVASIANLNRIAAAGGTDRAAFIDTSGAVDQQFLEALRGVTARTVECRVRLGDGPASLDYLRASVSLEQTAGVRSPLAFAGDSTGCGDNPQGWFYEGSPDAGTPAAILLCSGACDRLQGSTVTGLRVAIGCGPE